MSDITLPPAIHPRIRTFLIRAAMALAALATVAAIMLLADYLLASRIPAASTAASHPFAAGIRETAFEPQGIGGAILAVQSAFYTRMIAALQMLSTQASAFWTLVTLGFAYGVFHAVGPGHGKAVIAGYLVADDRSAADRASLRRGLLIAFAAALLQSVSAILIVGILTLAFNATRATVNMAAHTVEQIGFGLVCIAGLMMLWRRTARLVAPYRPASTDAPAAGDPFDDPFAGVAFQPPAGLPSHSQSGIAASGRASRFRITESHDLDCEDECCTHAHLLSPAEVRQLRNWREMAVVTLSAGIRPCTGAIIVLVFALSQGAFAAGVAATLAMSLGVFITVGTLASMAVYAKHLTARMAGRLTQTEGWRGRRAVSALEMLACAFIAMVGFTLMRGLG